MPRSASPSRAARLRRLALPLVLALLGLAPGVALAGRPLDTEDTATVEPGKAELELSLDYAKEPDGNLAGAKGVLSIGLAPRFEGRIEATGLLVDADGETEQHGVGDTLIGFKYRLLDESPERPALLGGLTLRLPTGDEDEGLGTEGVDVGVLLAASKAVGPVVLTWNAGYTFVTADRTADFRTLAGSIEYAVAPGWSLVGEVVGWLGARTAPDTGIARIGAVHALTERGRLDAAVGTGLTASSPDLVVTAGVTFSF